MGTAREVVHMRLKASTPRGIPAWLDKAAFLPNRKFITDPEEKLIDLVRKNGECSRGDLVAYTDYSRTKIASCLESLIDKKIIVANNVTEYSGGRRSKTFRLNEKLGLVAGLDIGATSIDLGIADFTGRLLAREAEPASVRDGPIKILGRACSMLEKKLKENSLSPEKLHGIGIGVPGPVDFSAGTVVSPPLMPGWDCYPIIQTVQQWFPSANVVVDNDVNVMALGELSLGAARGVDNLIFVKIGTGIGAGIICEGRIYRGSSGCAGDIGHICVDKSGSLCHCGNRGCLETAAGGPAIAERSLQAAKAGKSPILLEHYEKNGHFLRAEDVGDAAREGDALATEVIRESGQLVGEVLAALVNFYNPDMIVIAGGVSSLGNLLLSSIRQAVFSRSLPLATRNLEIVFSGIGSDAGIFGAVNLALNYIFTVGSLNSNGDRTPVRERA